MLCGQAANAAELTVTNFTKVGPTACSSMLAVKQLEDAGTDVNAKYEDENTPLHRAAYYGHKEIVVLLIAKGADVNAKGNSQRFGRAVNGETPLDWTIRGKHIETADLLRKHGGKTGEELKAEGK